MSRQFSVECDIYSGLPEIKTAGDFMAFAYNDPNLVYPDRILHSTILLGDSNLYLQAKLKALEELKERKVGERLKDQLKSYQRAIETGSYRHQPIFDKERGIQYYQESDDPKLLRLGFKSAFLRAVQRKLDLLTREGILNQQLEARIKQRYIEGLSNTLERIEFLSEIGLIPREMAKPLIEAYYWFLQRYHQAQDQYKNTRELVELPFDLNLFGEHQQTILEFLKI